MAQHIDDLLRGAVAAHQVGDRTQAERLYRLVLATEKRNPDALHFLGLLRAENGQLDEAAQLLAKAARANPRSADTHANLGRVLSLLNRHHDALHSYEKALGVDPDHPAALINAAGTLLNLNLSAKALPLLDRLLGRQPQLPIALHNRCVALLDLQRYDGVVADADTLLSIDPKDAEAWYKKGIALSALRRHDEAFKAFDAAYAGRPGLPGLEGRRLQAKLFICDWTDIGEEIARLRRHVQDGQNVTTPFALLSVARSPAEQLRCAQTYVKNTYPTGIEKALSSSARRTAHSGRVRLAYLSADFRDHAMAYAITRVLELHDRNRFETVGVSFGRDDESAARARIVRAFDRFLDVRASADAAVAAELSALDIDICIDLCGFTTNNRAGILARRPAPLQVAYVGFPGTLGAAYIDYVLGDRIVTPSDEQAFYAERIIQLPDTYWPTDSTRQIPGGAPSRAEVGLPDRGFVFCCFNNNYKIVPAVFDAWMRLLGAVNGSVLWLLEGHEAARENLTAAARARGIDPTRLVFARRVPMSQYLAQHRLADLFLDTLPYNAHSTCSDALWAGLPVVTCLGETFAGRVGASLLHAVGLPELITRTLDEYEALALRLAREPGSLAQIKAKLMANRDTCPLFDSARTTRHIEAAYTAIWERHRRGKPPAGFAIDPVAPA